MIEKTIIVIPCGTKVSTLVGNIEGMITSISLDFDVVTYKITYALKGELIHISLYEQEFKIIEQESKVKIGYKKSGFLSA